MKKCFLEDNGVFDEQFKYAAYEDIELGYRLSLKGMKLFFSNKAKALHNHKMNEDNFALRMRNVGKSAKLLFEKHPELKDTISLSDYTLGNKTREVIDPILFMTYRFIKTDFVRDRYFGTKALEWYMEGYLQ